MTNDPWDDTRSLSEDFTTPITDRWFEDYRVGDVHEYGYLSLSEDNIVEFARRYDPQRIHTDVQWARTGPFGGLIASGIQTMGVFMRLYANHYVSKCASLASPGVDELRWIQPVRPGDELRLRTDTRSTRRSASRSDRGVVTTLTELLNHHDEVVYSQHVVNFFAVRPN